MSEQLITLGMLADRLGIKVHRAEYLVRSRQVEPIGTAGRYRLFDERAVEKLEQELDRAKRNK